MSAKPLRNDNPALFDNKAPLLGNKRALLKNNPALLQHLAMVVDVDAFLGIGDLAA